MQHYWNTRADKFMHNIIGLGIGIPWFEPFRVVENVSGSHGQSLADMMARYHFLHMEYTIDQRGFPDTGLQA
jgi:hypothetical protein